MRYLFEEYALDADRRELIRGTRQVSVEPQVFDLLFYLIRNRERVVSKDDLIASVWQGRIVSESALSTRINAARSGSATTARSSGSSRRCRAGASASSERSRGAGDAEPARSDLPRGISDKPSIAVLPFGNLSGDPEQDYFTDGIVEDITTALSRNRAFFVIARNSSFTYKGTPVESQQVARELGVRYVLEGSVRKSGSRVRVTGQLIEAESGRHLWADKFDGDMSDIFELQDQIVTRVVGAIAPQLEKAEIDRANQPRPAISPPTISTCAASPAGTAGPGGQHEGAAALLRGDREGSRFLDPLWPGCILLFVREGEQLGSELRRQGDRPARRAGGGHRE